jgi:hypothetical protein
MGTLLDGLAAAGVLCLVAAAFLVSIALGLAVLGGALLALAAVAWLASWRPGDGREPMWRS